MEETHIILKNDESFAKVVRLVNGLEVGDKRIKTNDLLSSLFDMMEDNGFSDLVLSHSEAIQKGLIPFIDEQEPEKVNNLLKLFLERASHDADPELILSFLETLTNQFNIDEASPDKISMFFKLLLRNVKETNDVLTYKDVLYTLLDRLDVSRAEQDIVNKVLELVLKRANNERNMRVVESLFYTLAAKSRGKWVRQVLAPYVKKGIKTVRSPILPKNCIVYQEELDGTEIFIIEVDKQQFDVTYHKTPFKQVGHPKLLFEFHVRANRIDKCRLYALKDRITKPTSKLYRYPFSNVFEDYTTCWPELKTFVLQDVHQITNLPYLFINSPSNDHLFRGANLRELFATLEDQEYDDELLEDTGLVMSKQFEME